MTFHSKIDGWLLVVLIAAPMAPLFLGIARLFEGDPEGWIAIAAALFISALYALILPCKYTLHTDALEIRSGLCIHQRIRYQDIMGVEKSASILSAPALSLQRISIRTRTAKILISPRDREHFMRLLQERIAAARI